MKYLIAVALFYFSTFALAAQDSPCPKSFEVFKSEVHPFLRKNCAGCHGDEGKDFDRLEFMAPPHSVAYPLTSYMKTRGYLNLSAPDKSRLVMIGENGHCVDRGGDEGCGAKPGEISKLIAKWVGVEKTCTNHSNVVASDLKNKKEGQALTTLMQNGAPLAKPESENLLADVKQMAMGQGHVCAIIDDGKLKCWGDNSAYQTGIFADISEIIPASSAKNSFHSLPLPGRVLQVGTGVEFTCAILDTGKVLCWGSASSGQLGNDPDVEVEVKELKKFHTISLGEGTAKQLAVGHTHACVLMAEGDVKCWGANNDLEVLGYREPKFKPHKKAKDVIASLDFGDRKVQKISAGEDATCVIFDGGEVMCWGKGDFFSGGKHIGAYEKRELLSQMPTVDLGQPAMDVIVGSSNACAVLVDGSLKCWGASGILGPENSGDFFGPADLKKLKPIKLGGNVKAVALANATACAILESGSVKCWGQNDFGQFGSGDIRELVGFGVNEMSTLMPALLGAPATSIATNGRNSICAITTRPLKASQKAIHRVQCWGDNSNHILGLVDENSRGQIDMGDAEPLPPALIFKDLPQNKKPQEKNILEQKMKIFSAVIFILFSLSTSAAEVPCPQSFEIFKSEVHPSCAKTAPAATAMKAKILIICNTWRRPIRWLTHWCRI